MLSFDLRETREGFVLSGGQLEKPLQYHEKDAEAAIRLVGFLSQRKGSDLRIYGPEGELRSSRHREAGVPLRDGSLGSGLRGDSALGN